MIQRQPTPLAQLFVVVFLSSLQVAEVLSRTADEAAATWAESKVESDRKWDKVESDRIWSIHVNLYYMISYMPR